MRRAVRALPWVLALSFGCARAPATAAAPPRTQNPSTSSEPEPGPEPFGLECTDTAVLRGAPPPDGLRAWCELPDGREHGPMRSWHDEQQLKTEGGYEHGEPHGHWRSWDPSGALRSEGDYDRGTMVGTWTTFFANGQEATEIRYDGERADYRAWYSDGTLRREGRYLGGEPTGTWKEWDASGRLLSTTEGEYAASTQTIGIPECDRYLQTYAKCMREKMPASVRDQVNRALEENIELWRKQASSPDGRAELVGLCKTAYSTMLRSLQSLGCTSRGDARF